jgi:hypothetical protein
MKPLRLVVILAVSVLFGAVVSGTVTMGSWASRIEDKAFHCFDIGFGSFWTDMDLHRSAGDTISSDWTWERLKVVRVHYIEGFWLLLAAVSFASFLILRKLLPNAPHKTTGLGAVGSDMEPASRVASSSVLGR